MASESISFKTYLSGRQVATPPAVDDVFPVLQGGADVKKIKWGDLLAGTANYCEDTGAVNALVAECDTNFTAYVEGLPFSIKVANTNTGAATLRLNSMVAKTIKKNGTDDLAAGDLVAGQIIRVAYDGTNFQMLSSTVTTDFRYAADTGAANAYVIALSPALTAHVVGLPITFKAANGNNGASTIAINGLPAVALKKNVSAALVLGDIAAGEMVTVIYDGTNYQVTTARDSAPIGGEMLWPTETPPVGWLEENGASLVRATYPDLFSAIGTGYGAADATHFNLPDARGKFPRIWAHGQATDPDRATRTVPATPGATILAGDHVGTNQSDTIKAHQHTIGVTGNVQYSMGSSSPYTQGGSLSGLTELSGGNETRGVNTYRMMIMKAY